MNDAPEVRMEANEEERKKRKVSILRVIEGKKELIILEGISRKIVDYYNPFLRIMIGELL